MFTKISHYLCSTSKKTANLHPYLQTSLKKNGLYPLKPFQLQGLQITEKGHNFFINSCTGSGKTLTYLVPIFNTLLNRGLRQPFHGAIILTLNKQLVAQIYRTAKMMDSQQKFGIFRTGTMNQVSSKQTTKDGETENSGILKYIFWQKTDILISTPQALMNQLTLLKGQKKNIIDPQFMVIDEADLLLQIDKNVSRNTDKVIQSVRKNSTQSNHIKYLLAASSFPKKYKGESSEINLKKNFKTLEFIQGVDRHKLPNKIDLFFIEMNQKQQEKLSQTYHQRQVFPKLLRKKQRLIIFCKHRDHIESVGYFIRQHLKIECSEYYAELRTDQRTAALSKFDSGDVKIFISSDLGSRGLDFTQPVDCIIQYDMAENIVNFLNRAGRTGRNDLPGEIITFVEEKNKTFFQHLQSLKQEDEQLDELFSRKRSYSKLYKNKESNESQ